MDIFSGGVGVGEFNIRLSIPNLCFEKPAAKLS